MALVGCGVMGLRHARVLAADPGVELVTHDLVPERARAAAERFGGRATAAVPGEIDAAVIATPSSTHADVAHPLLARGVWCLVEKPLAHTVDGARALDGPRCAVGHVERFNPAVRAAGPMSPRIVDAKRAGPPSGRGLDVDVVMDLMIHDIDLVLQWAAPGADVEWIDAAGVGPVDGGRIDTASVRMRTTCGMAVSLLASRVAERAERTVQCYEPGPTVGRTTVLDLAAGRATRDGVPLPVPAPHTDALTHQWAAFVGAVRGAGALPSPAPAIRAVEVAERVVRVVRGGEAL